MPGWTAALSLAAGGALGALARYGVSSGLHRVLGHRFPWGTLAVNLLGCFLIGFLAARWDRADLARNHRLFWGVGFLGAFTTYSAFALETGILVRDGAWGGAGAYVGLHLVFGLVALFLGFAAARLAG